MLKRFSISLIIVSTIVYGSMFFMGIYHGTGFFEEILIQVNRLSVNLSKKQEIIQSKFILKTIIENEHPPDSWKGLIVHNQIKADEELFYYYKIWTIKTGLSLKDITDSYPIFEKNNNNINIINIRYGKAKPVLQFSFFRDKAGNLKTGLFFPLNEKPISADYNKDKKVDYKDVILARKAEQKGKI
ncbi:hypothetical protein [Desulfobacula sp.]|uniref:hypothetical protein n=1 Tax=Desulfobacula sp. TaxID=2593537 RepID=UPI001D799E75|nr:hypothetical protein [Desulfobacula sp.]